MRTCILSHLIKNKKCGYRSNRTKSANSDSRQTNWIRQEHTSNHYRTEFAFLSNSTNNKKMQEQSLLDIKSSCLIYSISLAQTFYHINP